MRLEFDKDDWLHVVMAVRVAQKVLVAGEHRTAAWEPRRGHRMLGQLLHLVKTGGRAPQIATKIELSHLMGMMPDSETPCVASAQPPSAPQEDTRIAKLEARLEALAQIASGANAPTPPEGETDALRAFINEQNEKIFTYLDQLEDRLRAVESAI